MRVTPLPGVEGEQLQKTLREQHSAVYNIWSGHHGPAQGWLDAYLEWATGAVQHLGSQISRADLDRLVLSPGYERLLSVAGRLTSFEVGTQRVLNGMVSLELQQRVAAFEAAFKELDEQLRRWSRLGAFLVADTTVFIEHEDKLEILDLAALADAEDDLAPVHLLVPIVVVDELTGLKDKADKPYKRWRAGYTLAVFDRIFTNGTGPSVLRAAPPAPGFQMPRRAEVTAEIILDPPGHVRLPINDDELVDRTLAIQALAGRTVTLVTFDTNQSTRARAAGLTVNKQTKPIGDEPKRN